jgi:CarboxypepD_reg-like domain
MSRIIGAILLVLAGFAAAAQTPLTGRVLAQGSRQPLPQATVQVVGQPITAVTDEAGRFTLSLPAATPNAVLAFSHLGYQSLSVPARQLGAEVALQEQSYLLGEVQVSYGQLRRRLLRQWQLAPASIDTLVAATLREAYRQNPRVGAEWAANCASLREAFARGRYEFRDNGVLRGKGDLARGRGRWQLDEATGALTVENMGGGLRSATVQELTAERLVLQRPGVPPLVLLPVK